jgi:hypothetical protein
VLLGTVASTTGQIPLWLGGTEVGGLLIAACTAIAVLSTVQHHAFRASSEGIWLGIRTTRKRPRLRQVHLSWAEIAQLRMTPRRYGVLLEITLSPAARIVHRPGAARQLLRFLGALLMPFMFGRGTPALTMARMDPPRYQIKICDRTAIELKHALAAVHPDTVHVGLLRKKGLRFVAPPPPRKPVSRRPPTPVA